MNLTKCSMNITIDPKLKNVNVQLKTIDEYRIKSLSENYRNLNDYEIVIKVENMPNEKFKVKYDNIKIAENNE